MLPTPQFAFANETQTGVNSPEQTTQGSDDASDDTTGIDPVTDDEASHDNTNDLFAGKESDDDNSLIDSRYSDDEADDERNDDGENSDPFDGEGKNEPSDDDIASCAGIDGEYLNNGLNGYSREDDENESGESTKDESDDEQDESESGEDESTEDEQDDEFWDDTADDELDEYWDDEDESDEYDEYDDEWNDEYWDDADDEWDEYWDDENGDEDRDDVDDEWYEGKYYIHCVLMQYGDNDRVWAGCDETDFEDAGYQAPDAIAVSSATCCIKEVCDKAPVACLPADSNSSAIRKLSSPSNRDSNAFEDGNAALREAERETNNEQGGINPDSPGISELSESDAFWSLNDYTASWNNEEVACNEGHDDFTEQSEALVPASEETKTGPNDARAHMAMPKATPSFKANLNTNDEEGNYLAETESIPAASAALLAPAGVAFLGGTDRYRKMKPTSDPELALKHVDAMAVVLTDDMHA